MAKLSNSFVLLQVEVVKTLLARSLSPLWSFFTGEGNVFYALVVARIFFSLKPQICP